MLLCTQTFDKCQYYCTFPCRSSSEPKIWPEKRIALNDPVEVLRHTRCSVIKEKESIQETTYLCVGSTLFCTWLEEVLLIYFLYWVVYLTYFTTASFLCSNVGLNLATRNLCLDILRGTYEVIANVKQKTTNYEFLITWHRQFLLNNFLMYYLYANTFLSDLHDSLCWFSQSRVSLRAMR